MSDNTLQILEKSKRSKAYRTLNNNIGKAINKYDLIKNNDKILVAVSGGKDSLTMLYFFEEFRKKAPINFTLLAVNLDQKHPGFPGEILPNLFKKWSIPYHIEEQDTYSIVKEKTVGNYILFTMQQTTPGHIV